MLTDREYKLRLSGDHQGREGSCKDSREITFKDSREITFKDSREITFKDITSKIKKRKINAELSTL